MKIQLNEGDMSLCDKKWLCSFGAKRGTGMVLSRPYIERGIDLGNLQKKIQCVLNNENTGPVYSTCGI